MKRTGRQPVLPFGQTGVPQTSKRAKCYGYDPDCFFTSYYQKKDKTIVDSLPLLDAFNVKSLAALKIGEQYVHCMNAKQLEDANRHDQMTKSTALEWKIRSIVNKAPVQMGMGKYFRLL